MKITIKITLRCDRCQKPMIYKNSGYNCVRAATQWLNYSPIDYYIHGNIICRSCYMKWTEFDKKPESKQFKQFMRTKKET
uniref:Uncharacterized protein n=2 Tax=viral metagenome TaxID=1070528 RepID=A0A6M3JMY7_9ZZZZ